MRFLSAVSLAVAVLAQAAPPIFRADTRLVQVNVVVHDRQGRPISDLTRGDFTLFEDGRVQPIEIFSVESSRATAAGATLAPDDFTNRLDGRAAGSVTVILFDRLNSTIDVQRRARGQVVKVLGRIQADDRVALYDMDAAGVRVLHDFTSDSAALVRAFASTASRRSPQLDASQAEVPEAAMLGQFLMQTAQDAANLAQHDVAGASAAALQAIAQRLAGIRGRKSVVWISSGFPLIVESKRFGVEPQNGVVSGATRALNDANVAIYPVDARGLVANSAPPIAMPEGGSTFQPSAGRMPASADIPDRAPVVQPRRVDYDALKAAAAETGGRAFFNTNDIGDAIRTAVDDGRLTYLLGYYPSHGKWDGTFHQISVKVNRPGLDVRYRSGYAAFPAVQTVDPGARERALLADIQSPLEATALGVTVHVTRLVDADDRLRATLTMHAEPGAVTLTADGDCWRGSLDFVIAQHLADGRWIETEGASLDLDLSLERRDQVAAEGVTFSRTIAVRDGADEMRIGLRDAASGITGTVVVPGRALRR